MKGGEGREGEEKEYREERKGEGRGRRGMEGEEREMEFGFVSASYWLVKSNTEVVPLLNTP